jgi:uncharacterized membrane protein YjgN (DUF898 family)
MKTISDESATETTENSAEQINEPVTFTGNTSEYFKIWIVNVCLSIITLGIYSAWAKVRNTRYLYGNTHLAGASFDYVAKPESILKGRLLAALFFLTWLSITSYTPEYELYFFYTLILMTPWLMVKALSFRANNTSYRNMRFSFHGSYSSAMIVYWGYLLFVSIITLGLAYPWALNKKQQFIINHSAYGSKRFSFSSCTKEYYGIFIGASFFGLVIGILASYLFQEINSSLNMLPIFSSDYQTYGLFFTSIFIVPCIGYLAAGTYIQTHKTNYTLSAIKIDQLSLSCDLSVSRMTWLYSSNIVAIICSMGLLIPWAKIRTYQYRVESIKITGLGNLDNYIVTNQTNQQALGDSISDIFDVEIGL